LEEDDRLARTDGESAEHGGVGAVDSSFVVPPVSVRQIHGVGAEVRQLPEVRVLGDERGILVRGGGGHDLRDGELGVKGPGRCGEQEEPPYDPTGGLSGKRVR